MPSRDLPARPHLEHLKNEAKALRNAFARGEPAAIDRVTRELGERSALKLTEAQRVIAREYGFASWARLRAHVLSSRGVEDAVDAFLAAVANGNAAGALEVLHQEPRIATTSMHVAAVLGLDVEVRRLIAVDLAQVHARRGPYGGQPLLWLCYSPFHGESAERDEGLAAATRALLDAGADPAARDQRHGVPALYAVTGVNNAPRIARILLDAGAPANDGESLFHAAERFHEESLELLLEYGADVNESGDWGNTPLYFLLRYWDVATMPRVKRGLLWLLEHGADPNVPCDRERWENSLHVAVRVGQDTSIVRLLLQHGADVRTRDADGRTAWLLAKRGGYDDTVNLLEEFGAGPESLTPADALLAACGRGDAVAARHITSTELIASLSDADLRLLPHAASRGRFAAVQACLEAGFPVDASDETGATALHHAAIHGHAAIARMLLERGADFRRIDGEHHSTPMGWACFGADYVEEPDGEYEATVRALLHAGARHTSNDHPPRHAGVRSELDRHGSAEL